MAGFRPREHIRRRADFQTAYDRGTKIHSRYATFFVLPTERGWSRLGIAATRKLGGAVVRNRAKRLIREVFRLSLTAPGLDIVVVPKRELLEAGLQAIEADYRNVLDKHARRQGSPGPRRSL